ncbi:MAG: hypothetical protein V1658_00865, partial [Candidatus Micrarchaeota archaeon]
MDFEKLAHHSAKLTKYGPASEYPGTIGSMFIMNMPGEGLRLSDVQAHSSSKLSQEMRPIQRRYSGWRHRSYLTALDIAKKNNLPLILTWKDFHGVKSKAAARDFLDAAKKAGAKVSLSRGRFRTDIEHLKGMATFTAKFD